MGYTMYVEAIFGANMKAGKKDNSPKVLTFKFAKAPDHIKSMIEDINAEIVSQFKDKLHLNEYDPVREDKKLVNKIIKALEAAVTGSSQYLYRENMIVRDSKGNYKASINATGWPQVICSQDNEYWNTEDDDDSDPKKDTEYANKVDNLVALLKDIHKKVKPEFEGRYHGYTLDLAGDGDGDLSWEITFKDELAMRLWDEISSKTFPESVIIVKDEKIGQYLESGNQQNTSVFMEEFREEHKVRKPETPKPEYNTDMTEAQAKRTLGSLSSGIMEDKKKKVTQYTANIYANIITKNLLPVWSKGFKRLKITLGDDRSPIVEFITPAMTQDFAARFVHGRESLNGHLHKSTEIRMKISPKVFQTMEHRDDAYHFFKNAVIYYSSRVEKLGTQLMAEVSRLGHNMKHLIATSKLSGLVIYPLSMLFTFDNVKMSDRNAFTVSKEDIASVNKFVRNIATRYAAPEREKKQIVDDLRDMVKTLKEHCESSETLRELSYLPEAVNKLFNGGFETQIVEASRTFIDNQIDRDYKPAPSVKPLYERFFVKKLKKIPRDLVVYITIEAESIKDANDKMMIAAYTTGKIEIVEWYIELLDVGSKKYIVPHTKQQLQTIRTQLLACLKKIMDTPVPDANRPIIDIRYPKGYEG